MNRFVLAAILVLLTGCYFSDAALAQVPDTLSQGTDVFEYFQRPGPEGNRLRIIQSDSIRLKVNRQAEQNRFSQKKMQGFRVRIFF